jgi:hypothetical protein
MFRLIIRTIAVLILLAMSAVLTACSNSGEPDISETPSADASINGTPADNSEDSPADVFHGRWYVVWYDMQRPDSEAHPSGNFEFFEDGTMLGIENELLRWRAENGQLSVRMPDDAAFVFDYQINADGSITVTGGGERAELSRTRPPDWDSMLDALETAELIEELNIVAHQIRGAALHCISDRRERGEPSPTVEEIRAFVLERFPELEGFIEDGGDFEISLGGDDVESVRVITPEGVVGSSP